MPPQSSQHTKVSGRKFISSFTRPAPEQVSQRPPEVLKELTRNLVQHRRYDQTNAPGRISWFNDRIEFNNPGGPFGAVTVDNFGQPHLADYRNPNVAEAMRVLGLVQKFGAGIAITRAALCDNGNPAPEFTVSPSHVLVTLRCAP